MGEVFKRGRVYWIDFYAGGERIRESAKTKVKREAEEFLTVRKSAVLQGTFARERKVTLKELGERYMGHSKMFKRSWKRDEQLLGDLKRFFGDPLLKNITADRVEEFQRTRKQEVSNATTNRAVALLKRMLFMAEKWGMHSGNVVRFVPQLPEAEFNPRILSNEDAQKLVDASPDDVRDLLEFDLNTGLRKSDAYGLKWENVDLERAVLKFVVKKTNKVQEVPLNPAACDVLRRQPRVSEYVFINARTKKPIKDIRVVLNGAAERAGLGKFKLHTIRHTVATKVTRATDLATAQVLLGHKSPNTTRRYVATDMPRMKNAADAIMWRPDASDDKPVPEENADVERSGHNLGTMPRRIAVEENVV
jgi:integrase